MAEALKGIKIEFKTDLSSGKNVSIGVWHKMESTLKVTEVETCKNTQFLINKFHFGGALSYMDSKKHNK